jgi:integrase
LQITRERVKMRDEALVRDKSYQRHPIGLQAKRWLETLRFEDFSPNTLEAYEIVAARLALAFPDFQGLHEFRRAGGEGVGLLRDFIARGWPDATPSTRRARTAALRSFFRWAHDEGIIEENACEKLRVPRRRDSNRHAHPRSAIALLVMAQPTLRDQVAIQLLARLGLRKNELRLLRVRDINLSTDTIRVSGKGGRVRVLPLALDSLRRDLYLHIQGEDRKPMEYLVYPKQDATRPMDESSIHRWFKRCLDRAGLTDFPMHELRHTAAHELYSLTGNIVLASMLLGHENVGTTQTYLHPTSADLATGMRLAEAAWREQVNEITLEEHWRL